MQEKNIFDDEPIILILVDEEGNEREFELIAELEIEGNTYKALLPLEEEEVGEDEDEAEILLLKVMFDEDGNECLIDIEDDEEWQMVADAWEELVGEDNVE